jgi:outer membrane lipoprotein SlyB
VRRPLVATVAAVALAGCGGGASASSTYSASSSRTTITKSTTTRPAPHKARSSGRLPAHVAPVGRAQRVHAGGSTLSVTVAKVYGSLSGTGAALLPGTRAAGVELTIRNDAGATYDSTASGDVSVIISSGAAAPLFIKQGVCQTQLTDFESLIGVGESHSGCVSFAIPRRARVVGVRFSPHSRALGSVTWR